MTYNGHKNYSTWNVSLWLQNEEIYYCIAANCETYEEFRIKLQDIKRFWQPPNNWIDQTADGVLFTDETLDIPALDELVSSIKHN